MLICAGAAACANQRGPDLRPERTSVQIPRDCEGLAQEVHEPEWRKGENPKVPLARTTVALIEANNNLRATKACQVQQREFFANPPH